MGHGRRLALVCDPSLWATQQEEIREPLYPIWGTEAKSDSVWVRLFLGTALAIGASIVRVALERRGEAFPGCPMD